MEGKFVIGEKCRVLDSAAAVKKCFARAELVYSEDKHSGFLGQTCEVNALFADGTALVKFDDGSEVKWSLDACTRAGVSNLIRKGSGENWDKQQLRKQEDEMKKQLKKMKREHDSSSSSSSESSDSGARDGNEKKRKSRKKKKKKKKGRQIDEAKVFKKGDKVMAKFRDEMMQGTVTSYDFSKNPPYEVKIDEIGVTYQMHPHELEFCEDPEDIKQNELLAFLTNLNLHKCHQDLIEDGFETVDDVKAATMDDFLSVGMKRGHARRLFKACETLKEKPEMGYQEVNRNLQKRASFQGHRQSLMNALNPRQVAMLQEDAQIGLATVNEYPQPAVGGVYQTDGYQDPGPAFPSIHTQQAPPQITSPSGNARSQRTDSTSSNLSVWEEDGYLIIPFDKRPLGFGIMSPLFVGTMVSTITDETLKKKGLGLGLPLLSINNFDVTNHGLESVANILSRVELPFTVTFGLQPYFKPGQKVMVSTNNKWYNATVIKMSKTTRKVTVKYDGNPFRFSNTEKIADYNRIKQPSTFQNDEDAEDDVEAPAAYKRQASDDQGYDNVAPAAASPQAAAVAYQQEEKQDDYSNEQEYNQVSAAQLAQLRNASAQQNAAAYQVDEYQNQPYVEQQQANAYYAQNAYAQQDYAAADQQEAYYPEQQQAAYNAAAYQQYANYQQPVMQNAQPADYGQALSSGQAAAILAAANQAEPQQGDD